MFLYKTLFIKSCPLTVRSCVDGGELVNETGRCTNRRSKEKIDMKEKKSCRLQIASSYGRMDGPADADLS